MAEQPMSSDEDNDQLGLKALKSVRDELINKLHPSKIDVICDCLASKRILGLTLKESKTIKSRYSQYGKASELIDSLARTGHTDSDVVQFCQILYNEDQPKCGRILFDALCKAKVDVSSVIVPPQTPPVVRNTAPKCYVEMKDLKDAFITLVREVKEVGESLDPKDLRTICIQLLNEVSSTKRNVQEDIDALRRCDGDYIGYLQPYWDSLDSDLLDSLIRQLKNSKLNEDWEKYRTQVKKACTATLEECRRSLPQGRKLPPNQISVGIQTAQPPNDVTVQKILDLKDYLIKIMGLKEADFVGFASSDVTLFFTVSRSRLAFLIYLFTLHRLSLWEFSIIAVFVPGEFIYDAITDQEFPYPEATSQRSEPVLEIKDLKEEMLHQFEQLQTSKANEDAMKYVQLQNESIALKMKLKEEETLRKKAEEEQRRIAGELVKMEKKWSESGSKSNVIPKKALSDVESLLGQSSESVEGLKDKIRILVEEWSKISGQEPEATSLSAGQLHQIEDLKEEMLRQFEQLQTSKMEKKWSESSSKSNTIPKKAISDVEGLLGQPSESVEGLQDKIRILVEEWSKISEHEPEATSLSAGQLHQIEDLKEEMLRQFEQLQTSKMEKKWSEGDLKSYAILKKAISDVEGLLGKSSESVEGLQDKIRILVEEWSKISEHETPPGQLPLAETDLEDNDSIPEKPGSDPKPALEALRDVYANLVERLHSASIIEHLYSGRLLTKVEYDLAKSKESNYEKNAEVLGALMRRRPAEVVKFCQVLFEQNQHNCGRLLLDALNKREVDVSSVIIPSQTPLGVRSTSPKYYIEMEDLKDAFVTLVREVKKAGASLDPEGLRTICINLLIEVSSTKQNVQEDIDALRRCDGDYIGYLQPYWDSLDCNLLHRLILQLNKPELIEDWEKYRTQVKEACTATLEECRRSLPQGRELPPNQISVGFQTTQPPNDVTVQKMLDLKDFLIKRMGMEEADFAGFTNGDSEATSQRIEPVIQIKDLKEEILRQFEQFQASKVNEDAMKYVQLQNESIALKMKLKEEEMLRKKAEEEQRRIAGELVKMEKKWSESGSKSFTILKKAISDVEGLLGLSSESVEGLQDKIRILVEEWSKISEHELGASDKDPRPEATHKILKEKKVAYSLHPVIEKLGKPFSTVVSEFRKQVCSLSDDLYDEVVTLSQTTMAFKAHVSRLPDVPSHHRKDFIDHIIKHTTLFDVELIHEVANLLKQSTLTEAVVRYEAELEPLMRTSIAELTNRCEVMPTDQDSPEGTHRLVLKFPDDANVKDLYKAKDYLEKVLNIPDAKLLAFDFR